MESSADDKPFQTPPQGGRGRSLYPSGTYCGPASGGNSISTTTPSPRFYDCHEVRSSSGGRRRRSSIANAARAEAPTQSVSETPPRRPPALGRSPSSSSSRGGGGSDASSRRGSLESAGSARRLFRDGSAGGGSRMSVGSRVSVGSGVSVGSSASSVLNGSAHIALKAAGEGDEAAVLAFLESGGDVDAKSKTGASTPLSRAAAKGHLGVVTLLLERGAAVNIPGRGGLTPLHEAAGCGQLQVCRVLLGAGAAVAARDHSNRCPLHYAGSSVGVTQLLLDFGADPEAQDKNGQRPDAMAVSQEARAMLRDARCAVREGGVGDNASRVIASLRRELDNLEGEAEAARAKAAKEASRRQEMQTEVDTLRGHVSALSEAVEGLRKDASASRQEGGRASPNISSEQAAQAAELRQVRAALKVARAAAAEEQRRRQALEDKFDAGLAEAMGKARAVDVYSAAASGASGATDTDTPRLLGRRAPSPSSARGRGDGGEGEGEGEGGQMKRHEGEWGGEKAAARGSDGGDGWGGKGSIAGVSDGGGDGGACSLGRDGDTKGEEAQPEAAGKERESAQEEEEEEEGGEKERRLEALVAAAEAAVEKTRAAAAVKEEENQGRGFVEQRIEELERQEAAALAAALAAAATLPSMTLPDRRRYTAGVISPRLGSPSYLASKGFSSFGGVSTAAATEEVRRLREAGKCRSLESAPGATATGPATKRGKPPRGDKLAIPAWAPSSTIGAVKATPAAPGGSVDDEQGKHASRAETPTATPTVTPRESVESAPESSVPAAEGTAAAAAAAAAAAPAEGVSGDGRSATQPERGAAATVGEEEGRENAEEGGRGAVDDDAHRAAAAEALAARLQEQLEEMKDRLSELSSENWRMQKEKGSRESAAAERKADTEGVARNWTAEDHPEEKEMEMEMLCDHQPGPYEPEEEGKGMLLRFLRGLQPVSYVYWED